MACLTIGVRGTHDERLGKAPRNLPAQFPYPEVENHHKAAPKLPLSPGSQQRPSASRGLLTRAPGDAGGRAADRGRLRRLRGRPRRARCRLSLQWLCAGWLHLILEMTPRGGGPLLTSQPGELRLGASTRFGVDPDAKPAQVRSSLAPGIGGRPPKGNKLRQ